MNSNHEICGSDLWREMVREQIVPWALGDRALGDDLLEVGPGYGATTEVFCERVARLTAVEIDPLLAERLAGRFAATNVVVVEADATNPQIAEAMFISRETVKTHLSHVFAKLGVSSRSALAAEAVRRQAPEG